MLQLEAENIKYFAEQKAGSKGEELRQKSTLEKKITRIKEMDYSATDYVHSQHLIK